VVEVRELKTMYVGPESLVVEVFLDPTRGG